MSEKKTQEIVKRFTFSKEELTRLQDIEFGMISFRTALDGMQTNKYITLQQVYKRLGIDGERDGYTRNISFNLGTNEVVCTDRPKPKEEKAEPLAKK